MNFPSGLTHRVNSALPRQDNMPWEKIDPPLHPFSLVNSCELLSQCVYKLCKEPQYELHTGMYVQYIKQDRKLSSLNQFSKAENRHYELPVLIYILWKYHYEKKFTKNIQCPKILNKFTKFQFEEYLTNCQRFIFCLFLLISFKFTKYLVRIYQPKDVKHYLVSLVSQ